MIFGVPSYYKEFHCIADRCQDSCCIGWEIDIDDDTFAYYKSVKGTFGRRLSEHMTGGEEHSFHLTGNGWCPFLNDRKLCDICIELGEEALSEVCTEYPRFTMEYENVREKTLSLSCEEVCRILFSSEEKTTWEERELPDFCGEADDGEPDGGMVDASWLRSVRACAVEILQDRSKPVFVRAAEYLRYCEKMQRELLRLSQNLGGGETSGALKLPDDRAESGARTKTGAERKTGTEAAAVYEQKWQRDCVCQTADEAYDAFLLRMERFKELEVLDAAWETEREQLLHTFTRENYLDAVNEFCQSRGPFEYEYEHLLVYFTYRYFMRAYYDGRILARAQFAAASVLMIRDMDVLRYLRNGRRFSLDDRIATVKLYSREVEHSEENIGLLAEDFDFEEVFSAENLCRALCGLQEQKREPDKKP